MRGRSEQTSVARLLFLFLGVAKLLHICVYGRLSADNCPGITEISAIRCPGTEGVINQKGMKENDVRKNKKKRRNLAVRDAVE